MPTTHNTAAGQEERRALAIRRLRMALTRLALVTHHATPERKASAAGAAEEGPLAAVSLQPTREEQE